MAADPRQEQDPWDAAADVLAEEVVAAGGSPSDTSDDASASPVVQDPEAEPTPPPVASEPPVVAPTPAQRVAAMPDQVARQRAAQGLPTSPPVQTPAASPQGDGGTFDPERELEKTIERHRREAAAARARLTHDARAMIHARKAAAVATDELTEVRELVASIDRAVEEAAIAKPDDDTTVMTVPQGTTLTEADFAGMGAVFTSALKEAGLGVSKSRLGRLKRGGPRPL